jgi:hypothetical protein
LVKGVFSVFSYPDGKEKDCVVANGDALFRASPREVRFFIYGLYDFEILYQFKQTHVCLTVLLI